jgi:hypothetical protein
MSAVHSDASRPHHLQHVRPLACLLVAMVVGTPSSLAQSKPEMVVLQYDQGIFVEAPSDVTYSKRNGLRLKVDSRWPNNYGYRPIRVMISSRRPTQGELRIKFRLHIAAWEQPALEVEQSFDMPQGATEAEAVVRLPQIYNEGSCHWDVWVDGVRDPELCVGKKQALDISATSSPRSYGATLRFICVKNDALTGDFAHSSADPIAATTFSIEDLPTHWIDYSPVDVVALAASDLQRLEGTRPNAMTALRRWLRAGGQVWVHSVGDNWDHLEDVERALGIDAVRPLPAPAADVPAPTNETDRLVFARGWKPLPIGAGKQARGVPVQHMPTGRVRMVSDPTTIARLKLDPDYVVNEEPAKAASAAPPTETGDSARWYLQRPAGLGRARVFRGGWDPVGFSIAWRMLGGGLPNQPPFESVPATPVTVAIETISDWPKRHGLSPDLANADFADFLVPGVGLAPVTEFRVLITMFVLVIGPLNYWLLMRANRLHLLLLTVPALAIGLTAALFGYAMLSDGLSTKARVRSFTTLDQSTGEAACWARLSYYAGLAPGNGLALSDDVAFYPILSGWDGTGDGDTDNVRTLEWRDGRQWLSTGWLRSRVPTQFLSVRSRKSPARIDFQERANGISTINNLGTRIEYLAVVDETGNVFAAKAIDEGAKFELQASTHTEALGILRQMTLAHQPQMPRELSSSHDRDSIVQRRRRRLFRSAAELEMGIERLGENLLSTAIADFAAPNAENVLNVPRRSYIAITTTGPEVDLGLPAVDEEASFHVLAGKW